MILVQESANSQEISIILNGGRGDSLILTDKETNISTTHSISAYSETYFQVISMVFPTLNGKFYDLEVKFEGISVYNGVLFCTNQTDFSINKDKYNEQTSENTYILLD